MTRDAANAYRIAFQKVEVVCRLLSRLAISEETHEEEYAYSEAKVRQAYKDWLGFAPGTPRPRPRSELAIATEQCLAIIDSWKVVSIFVPKGLIGQAIQTRTDIGTDESLSSAYRLGSAPFQPGGEFNKPPGP